ncbi:MAG: hypothetical protein ABGX23_03650 [Nautiliaceae bacterium]
MSGIVIVSKDVNKRILDYFIKNFDEKIFLVTPKKCKFLEIEVINDHDILIFEKFKNLQRGRWYYQQFLKYEVVLKFRDYKRLWIIDGDTVLRKDLSKEVLYSTFKPTYKKYNNFYYKVFQEKGYEFSFVTNQMVFEREFLVNMLNIIENKFYKNWMDVFLENIDEENVFSEYQAYGNFIAKNKNIQRVKIFRRMDLINDSIENALKKYDIIAYENHHKVDFLRKIKYKIDYFFGRSLG